MREERIIAHHKGIPIALSGDLQFYATPEEGVDLSSPTAEGINDEIDAYLATKRKQEKDPLNLAVVTTSGVRGAVKGIHMGTCMARGFPELGATPSIYPDVPWIVEVLLEMEKARESLKRADAVVAPYRMDPSRGYGRVAPAQYDGIMERLVSQYEEKRAAAEAR